MRGGLTSTDLVIDDAVAVEIEIFDEGVELVGVQWDAFVLPSASDEERVEGVVGE
jgi:hypothetical protein